MDYLASYYLIGGEPLLNRELPSIISAVHEKFGSRIGYIQIITNGSIVPSKELISVMGKCKVKVRISDYTEKISYKDKLEEVVEELKKGGIDCSISDYKSWMDIGFPHEVPEMQGSLREHMLNCSQGCHSVNDRKFYYCSTLWDAEKCGLHICREGDYLDLRKSTGNSEKDRMQILEYCFGIMENDYIILCAKCRGFGADNKYLTDVAEQMR